MVLRARSAQDGFGLVSIKRTCGLIVAAAALVLFVACAIWRVSCSCARDRASIRPAVRVALGASRPASCGQRLSTSLMLSFVGTIMGLSCSRLGQQGLAALIPPVFSRYAAPVYDARVIGFSPFLPQNTLRVARRYLAVSASGESERVVRSAACKRAAAWQPAAKWPQSGLAVGIGGERCASGRAMMTAGSLIELVNTDVGFKPEALYSVRSAPSCAGRANELSAVHASAGVIRDLHGVNQASAADVLPISGFNGMARLVPASTADFDGR